MDTFLHARALHIAVPSRIAVRMCGGCEVYRPSKINTAITEKKNRVAAKLTYGGGICSIVIPFGAISVQLPPKMCQ